MLKSNAHKKNKIGSIDISDSISRTGKDGIEFVSYFF